MYKKIGYHLIYLCLYLVVLLLASLHHCTGRLQHPHDPHGQEHWFPGIYTTQKLRPTSVTLPTGSFASFSITVISNTHTSLRVLWQNADATWCPWWRRLTVTACVNTPSSWKAHDDQKGDKCNKNSECSWFLSLSGQTDMLQRAFGEEKHG